MASPIRRRHAALRQPRGRIGHGLGKSKAQAPLLDAVPSPRGSPGTWVLTDCSHLPCFPHACLISLSCLCAPLYPPATSSTHRHTHTLTAHTPQPMHIMTSTHVCTQCAPMVHTHAPACAHMHTNTWAGAAPTHKLNAVCMHAETRTRSALRLAHIQACCGAHTPAQTHTVSLQWLPHGCTHTHKHSARGSRAHTHAHT